MHRALWAEKYRNDETGEICRFDADKIEVVRTQNALLNSYYDFLVAHYSNIRVVRPSEDLVYSDFAHRWGKDFFHFSDDYYVDVADKLSDALASLRAASNRQMSYDYQLKPSTFAPDKGPPLTPPHPLSDRPLLWHDHFTVSAAPGTSKLDPNRLTAGPGHVTPNGAYITVHFDDHATSQQLRFAVPEVRLANGFSMRLRLSGWSDISYIGIGYTEQGSYHHVKAHHPVQGEWFDFGVSFRDLAWGWRNNWERREDRPVSDVRFYIKGAPTTDARIDLSDVMIWQEEQHPDRTFGIDTDVPSDVFIALLEYQRLYFPDYARLARGFMKSGTCPLAGNTLLEWPVDSSLPPRLFENGTFQYSWHSLHPAVMLILLSEGENELAPLFAARELVTGWLDRSFDEVDSNAKYAWYDHGVAERALAMILLYGKGRHIGFDARFMTRLRRAIHRHAQLLSSEVFYSSHQSSRYHNHAWFQDLALMATGLAFPEWDAADLWVNTALSRAQDQFEALIIRDDVYAVFAENSVGYHFGVERLVSSIGKFAKLSGRDTDIPAIAQAMSHFSALMRYPDGKRAPSQGDTFRIANSPGGDAAGRRPYSATEVVILPSAGYAIARGNHADHAYMLVFFATAAVATHKHADNLSFTLYMDGVEWLIDPSFYSHEYTQPLPMYLRGPSAHNAFVLPGADYAITPGLSELSGHESSRGFHFEGRHTAVQGMEFSRSIDGTSDSLNLTFVERMHETNAGGHSGGRLMLHCGEGVEATAFEDQIQLTHPGSSLALLISLPSGCRVSVHSGKTEDPISGVAGLGFLQSAAIATVEVEPPAPGTTLQWCIRAVDRRSS